MKTSLMKVIRYGTVVRRNIIGMNIIVSRPQEICQHCEKVRANLKPCNSYPTEYTINNLSEFTKQ